MIVDDLKTVATSLGWHFNYGSGEWQNLGDYPEDSNLPFAQRKKYFLLLWKDTSKSFDKFGTTTATSYDCEFVFVVRSKITDKDYNTKYDEHIKNLETELEKLLDNTTICSNYQIVSWKSSEVFNQYDTNMDGLKVKMTVNYG